MKPPPQAAALAAQRAPSPAVLLATSFAFIIVQLDVTIVNVALPQIGQELGAGVGALQWVVDAYTLGFAVFLLAAGVMGDKYGARGVFLSGFGLFAAASVACALAPTAVALNMARAFQGIGAALLVPSSLSILNFAPTTGRCWRKRSAGGPPPAASRSPPVRSSAGCCLPAQAGAAFSG